MAERYQTKYVLPKLQYQEGSPIILQAGILLFDTQAGRLLAQLKFENISQKSIKAVFLSLFGYDALRSPAGESVRQQYLDLSVKPGQSFGDREPLFIHDASLRSIEVSLTGVLFDDETVWKPDLDAHFQPINTTAGDTPSRQLLEQLNRDSRDKKRANIQYVNAFFSTDRLWLCACGQWNLADSETCLANRWRHYYNGIRPHSGLGGRPPAPQSIILTA